MALHRRTWALSFVVLMGLIWAACATTTTSADDDGSDDDVPGVPDARVGGPPDSSVPGFPDATPGAPDAKLPGPPDAGLPPPPDAAPPPPDAAPSLFCTDSSTCASGTCCFKIGPQGLCVPGTEPIPGLCLPSSADAGPM